MKNDEITQVWLDEDERRMLQDFWDFIDSHNVALQLTGYNLDGFDTPFIRIRSLVHRLAPRSAVSFAQYTVDLMKVLFPSNSYKKFCDVAAALGITHNSSLLGSDVPRLWQEKNFESIREHNLDDLAGEWMLFKRLKESGFV